MSGDATATGAVSEVEPGLWVCAEPDVPSALADARLGVTHLISVGYPPPADPAGGRDDVKVLSIELEDDDDGDLLTQIPAATAFIRDALRLRDANRAMGAAAVVDDPSSSSRAPADPSACPGGVLVHCHAGVSRSAAIVIAHVMRARDVDPEEALRLVRLAHPPASPNEGFLAQLSLWHTMGCKLNMADEAYRLYSVAKLAREREYNGYVNATAVQPDPGASDGAAAAALVPFSGVDASASAPVGAPQGGGAEAGAKISCRKCRRLVARGANALPHQPGEGLDAFSWRRRAKTARAAGESGAGVSSTCQNIFLQPLAWMRGVEDGGVEGKLCCPRCDVKVGHFNWSGCQCSCGAWVTPAFYVQSGKVDVMPYETRTSLGPGPGGGAGTTSGPGETHAAGGVRVPRFAARPPVRRPSAGGGGT